MPTLDDLKKMVEELDLPHKNKRSNKKKISILVQEASDLAVTANNDREKLLLYDVTSDQIDRIPIWATYLQQTESKIIQLPLELNLMVRKFQKEVEEAKLLRKELINHYQYGLREIDSAQKDLARIKKGNSIINLIQDLLELSILVNSTTKQEKMEKIHFDFSLCEKANRASETLLSLSTYKINFKLMKSALILERDKIIYLLKLDTNAVKQLGRYVFANDNEHRQQYGSAYDREMKRKSRTRKTKLQTNLSNND